MRRRLPLSWPLLTVPDGEGALRFPRSLDQSVQERIQVVLSVRPGELMFHPEFGAGLDELLQEPNTLELRREIHDRIVESLRRWEPRIDVEGVDVEPVERRSTQVRVRIHYRLRRTGAPASLGLTLETGS